MLHQSNGRKKTGRATAGIRARPSGMPGAAVAMADPTAGRHIGGAYGRKPCIQDKNVCFWESRYLTVSGRCNESDSAKLITWVGATRARWAHPVSCLGEFDLSANGFT